MDNDSRILYLATDLILPLIVGYFLHQKHLMSDKVTNIMIKANIIVIYSLLTLFSFWIVPINKELLMLLPYGCMYVIFPGIFAALTFAKKHRRPLNRGSYIISSMISNIGTLGGVCAYIMYSDVGFAYIQVIATCQAILLVLVCFPLAAYYRSLHDRAGAPQSHKPGFRELFFSINQLSLLGIIFGLLLNYFGVERPQVLGDVFPYLIHINAWTALLPVGYLINFSNMRYYYRNTVDIFVIRFIVMPLFVLLTAKYLFNDHILQNTLIIGAFLPTAINAVLTARLYKLNVNMAVTSFFTTTAAFLLIVFPLIYFVMK